MHAAYGDKVGAALRPHDGCRRAEPARHDIERLDGLRGAEPVEAVGQDAFPVDGQTLEPQPQITGLRFQRVMADFLGCHDVARLGRRHQGHGHGRGVAVGRHDRFARRLQPAARQPPGRHFAVIVVRRRRAEGIDRIGGQVDAEPLQRLAHVIDVDLVADRL